jgi:hypothetical protein
MGRYAFFNTGLEYKFAFAVQPSEDILKFGGTPDFVYQGDNKHSWSIVDQKRILDRLRDIEISLGLPETNFDLYEKNLEGTHMLRHDLWDIGVNNMELLATYILGCLIYHQLLYKRDLNCTYES